MLSPWTAPLPLGPLRLYPVPMTRLLSVLLLFASACSTGVEPAPAGEGPPDANIPDDPISGQGLEVLVTSPESGAVFGQSALIQVALTLSGDDGPGFPVTLAWASDQDGDLLTEETAGSPTTTTLPELSAGTHILTVTATDILERQGSASLVVVVDRPPSGATLVILEPDQPRTSDNLEAVITQSAEDPEGDPVTYTYRWTV
ncbi:MAG: hypothetical protein VX938_05380, partial [Myxococcota bacterium]|nr:hypothetical protein [Myxococcota bacterium]